MLVTLTDNIEQEARLVSATDYYPFGMAIHSRSWQSEGYRFGFKTQEKTPEIAPDTYTAELWQYDSRVARRWNVDPVDKPWESSYAAFANNPIWFVDIDGQDTLVMHLERNWEEERVILYNVTFSIVRNGEERAVDTKYKISLAQNPDPVKSYKGHNRLYYTTPDAPSRRFKPIYDKMSRHQDWENTIRFYGDLRNEDGSPKGVFIHKGGNLLYGWSYGCLIPIKTERLDYHVNRESPADVDSSIDVLYYIRNLYDTHKENSILPFEFHAITNSRFEELSLPQIPETTIIPPRLQELDALWVKPPVLKPFDKSNQRPFFQDFLFE
ncbi:MAG: hypothetical protein JJT94_09790 [Bernardetiaceae bacterium]|nr:hypothetical protein [Bernardetiaceae bacterium]